jgi:hypothetical protein
MSKPSFLFFWLPPPRTTGHTSHGAVGAVGAVGGYTQPNIGLASLELGSEVVLSRRSVHVCSNFKKSSLDKKDVNGMLVTEANRQPKVYT